LFSFKENLIEETEKDVFILHKLRRWDDNIKSGGNITDNYE